MKRKGRRYAALLCACAMVLSNVPVYAADETLVDGQNETVQEEGTDDYQEVDQEKQTEQETQSGTAEQKEMQSGESMQNAEENSMPQIAEMSLDGIEDKENVETPANFNVKIKMKDLWEEGIEYIDLVNLIYDNSDNVYNSYAFSNRHIQQLEYENGQDTLTVPVTLDEYYEEGKYQLNSIQIERVFSDSEHMIATYRYDDQTESFIDESGNQCSYSGELDFNITKAEKSGQLYGQISNLEIIAPENKDKIKAAEQIMVSMDADNMKEGDSFAVAMTYYNSAGENYTYSNSYGDGNTKENATYKGGKIQFPIMLGKYAKPENYKLSKIVITDLTTKRKITYDYYEDEKKFSAYDSGNQYSFAYNGEADFTIINPEYGQGIPIEIKDFSIVGDKDKITPESDAKIKLKVSSQLNKGIAYVDITYKSTENGKTATLNKSFGLTGWFPEIDGEECEIPISLDHAQFMSTGNYVLERIVIRTNYYSGEEEVCYTNKDGKLVGEYSTTGDSTEIAYDSELDLHILELPEKDTVAPKINSIKIAEEDKTKKLYQSEMDNLKLKAEYTEDLSGIISCEIVWRGKNNQMRAAAEATFRNEKKKVGSGELEIIANMKDVSPDTYHATQLTVYDNAGLMRVYKLSDKEGILIDEEGKELSVDNISFTVNPSQDNGLKVSGMRWKDGMNVVEAGGQIKGYLTVQNTSQRNIELNPEDCYMFWSDSYAKCEGKKFVLKSGAEKELPFTLSIAEKGTASGIHEIMGIVLESVDKKVRTKYDDYDGYLRRTIEPAGITAEARIEKGDITCSYSVMGETNEEIEEEPVIESVSLEEASVIAGGDIKLKIKVPDKQKLPITNMNMVWMNKKNGQSFQREALFPECNYTYSAKEHCYYVSVPTNQLLEDGEYFLYNIAMSNGTGGFGAYSSNDNGIMYKYQTVNVNSFQTVSVQITKNDTPTRDFEAPVLESAELVSSDDKVTSPGEVTYRIKATDESKLSEVRLFYLYNKGVNAMTLKSSSVKEESEGSYLCTFKIDEYHESGDYQLYTIGLIDGSAARNDRAYTYNKETGTFESTDVNSVKVAGDLTLTKEGNEVIASGEKNLDEEAKKAAEGTTIVVADLQKELSIPKETMEEIKNKDLTLVVTDDDRTSKLIIKGNELAKIPEQELKITVERGMLTESEIQVGEKTDEMYYPVEVTTTDANIPITLRVKLDEEYLQQISKNNISLSRRNADGTIEVIQENVTVSEDGYVEYTFANGFSDKQIATQGIPSSLETLSATVLQAADLTTKVEEYEFIISAPKRNAEEPDIILGDIDQNGRVDIRDLMSCLNHVSQKALLTGKQLEAADVTRDGKVDIQDLMKLLNYVSGKINTL